MKKLFKKKTRKGKKNIRRYKRRSTTISRNMLGFPRQQVVSMRFNDYISLNAGVGTIASYLYRCNSVFDPDYSGVGHQPSAYDIWTQFYQHYVVIGSKITIQFNTNNISATPPCVVGVYVNDDTSIVPTTHTGITENRLGHYALYTPDQTTKSKKISIGFSPKKFFGIKDIKDNIDRLGALVTANPSEQAYFTIWVAGQLPTDDPILVNGWVTIDYKVLFSEPKDLPQS